MKRDVRVIQDEDKVLLVVEGRTILNLPYDAAQKLAQALHKAGKFAEEIAKHKQITEDGAILMRAGFPIGLANDPRVAKEVIQAGQYDPKLRRYLPKAGFHAQNESIVYAPSFKQHPPRPKKPD